MRIITKNGIIYNSLNISIIRDLIKSVKTLVAVVEDDRKLNYEDNGFLKEFIDDLTKEELDKGLKEVEKLCKENNNLDLLKEYYNLYYKDDNINLLIKLKELKLFEVNNNYNIEIDKVLKEYIPNTEILTWDIQETESRAFKKIIIKMIAYALL
ncbi:hypothetical protein [Campylobacter jejuni]|uniref:hypothetical protein n=1 Tax=Campylobacter jejuni TaxID=197 RepID=UPI0007413C85|nr:hypothetical protein [Campylobacter jejuni]